MTAPATLPQLVAAGLSDREIANKFGVHARTVLRWRQRATLPSRWTPTAPAHGTPSRYRRGCRCTPCTAANAARRRAWYRQRAYGSWQRRQT